MKKDDLPGNDRLNRRKGLFDTGDRPFHLESGRTLSGVHIAYETYGRLNEAKENAILLCHALTGSPHAAGRDGKGKPGWWDGLIGPGKAFDTDRFFVICPNVLGGCYGSTGPNSINPETGEPYGSDFPEITIRDIVRAQHLLIGSLGIKRLSAVAGGSMGGMQAFEWGTSFPDSVERLILIATAPEQSAWRLGVGAVAREAISLAEQSYDREGGLRLARMISMLTYRSHEEFSGRFGRRRQENGLHEAEDLFAVESYLKYKGKELAGRFDALTYRTLLGAMDRHDVAAGRGSLPKVLATLHHPTLCVGISSDMLYPAEEVFGFTGMIPDGRYREILSRCGHDAFLIEQEQLSRHIEEFLRTSHGTDSDEVDNDATDNRGTRTVSALFKTAHTT